MKYHQGRLLLAALAFSAASAHLVALIAPSELSRPARADVITHQKQLLPPPRSAKDQPPLPELTPAEKTYLIRLARRALLHSAQTNTRYQPADAPESLKRKDYISYVSARQAGHMIASIAGEGQSVPENIARAAEFVAGSKDFGKDKVAGIRDSVIELNVLGPGQRLAWDTLDHVGNAISPGVNGLAARVNDKTIAFKDAVAPTHGYNSELMVHKLIDKAGWLVPQVVAHKDKVTFYRFRSVHLLEWPNAQGHIELFRCAELIRTEQITRERVTLLIDLIGRYMVHRQLKNGLFSYDYSAPGGHYLTGDNGVRQAAATWAVSRVARVTGERIYEVAALKAIDAPKLRYLDTARTAACASYPSEPGREGLGATALLLCAIVDLPNNKPLASLRDNLAAGLLHQQRADGSFKVYYYAREDDANKFYYPGECLLALMKLHLQTGEKIYLDAVEKSFPYYRRLFDTEPKRSFVPWQAQAWDLAYTATGKKQYADFVFQISDYLRTFQADETADVYPDMVGGFVNERGYAGIGSAAFMEGMVAAHRTAVNARDAKRTERYARSLLLGARFLDQLTFKKADAFYCVSKRDVIGGLKMSPIAHTIRIDNCQHGVLALMGVREQLFPEPARPPSTSRPAASAGTPAPPAPRRP